MAKFMQVMIVFNAGILLGVVATKSPLMLAVADVCIFGAAVVSMVMLVLSVWKTCTD